MAFASPVGNRSLPNFASLLREFAVWRRHGPWHDFALRISEFRNFAFGFAVESPSAFLRIATIGHRHAATSPGLGRITGGPVAIDASLSSRDRSAGGTRGRRLDAAVHGAGLLMTMPGLALFYAGMVRKKNVLATMMQSFSLCALARVVWMAVGYSLAFGNGKCLDRRSFAADARTGWGTAGTSRSRSAPARPTRCRRPSPRAFTSCSRWPSPSSRRRWSPAPSPTG